MGHHSLHASHATPFRHAGPLTANLSIKLQANFKQWQLRREAESFAVKEAKELHKRSGDEAVSSYCELPCPNPNPNLTLTLTLTLTLSRARRPALPPPSSLRPPLPLPSPPLL